MAPSISPSEAVSAFLQSMIPAPVFLRKSFTSLAEIPIIVICEMLSINYSAALSSEGAFSSDFALSSFICARSFEPAIAASAR